MFYNTNCHGEHLLTNEFFLSSRLLKKVLIINLTIYFSFRILLLVIYNFSVTDHDQTLMWYATSRFAHGIFYEPMFFGQSYNTMVESLFAVPLYLLGVPLNIALPTVSFILGILPFLFLILFSSYKKHYFTANIILIFLASMSFDYDLITAMPRSFLPGLALAFIGVILLMESRKKISALLAGIFFLVAVLWTVSSITIILIGCMCLLVEVTREKTVVNIKKQLPAFLGGLLIGGVIYFLSKYFYVVHPEYDLFSYLTLNISMDAFFQNIVSVNSGALSYFTIFNSGVFAVILFLLYYVFLFLKRKELKSDRYTYLCPMILAVGIILTFSNAIPADDTIAYSQARMYLFIPICMGIILYNTKWDNVILGFQNSKMKNRILAGVLLVIMLFFCCYKTAFYPPNIHQDIQNNKYGSRYLKSGYVLVSTVEDVFNRSGYLADLAKNANVDMVLFEQVEPATYALAALEFGSIDTYLIHGDRRVYEFLNDHVTARSGYLLVKKDGSAHYVDPMGQTLFEWIHDHYE